LKSNTPQDETAPPPLARDRARELRRDSTEAEHRLWSHLRNKSLGVKFRRQHPIGPFIVDFFSLEAKLVVEIDGGQHDEDDKRRADESRTKFLEDRGYRILRFWNNEVLQ
jgi:very-short-patch-repair endonuclease